MGYLTVQDIAERLDVTVETVRRWLRNRELQGTPFGRAGYRIEEADLRAFLEQRREGGAASVHETSRHIPAPHIPSLEETAVTSILDTVTDAFLTLDRQWRVTYLNRQAEPVFQKTREELLGRQLWDAFPEGVGSTLYHKSYEAMQTQFTVRFEEWYPPLNRRFEIYIRPSQEELILSFHDITQRKRAEESLRVREQQHQAVLDALATTVAVLDSEGTIRAVNAAWKRFAQENCATSEQLERTGVGMNYLEVCRKAKGLGSEGAREALLGIEAVLVGRQASFTLEYPCHSPTQQRWFIMSATPLPENRGAVIAHVNITERKELEQQKDALLDKVSRELQISLAAISEHLQMAEEHLKHILHMPDSLPAEVSTEANEVVIVLERALHEIKSQKHVISDLFDSSLAPPPKTM